MYLGARVVDIAMKSETKCWHIRTDVQAFASGEEDGAGPYIEIPTGGTMVRLYKDRIAGIRSMVDGSARTLTWEELIVALLRYMRDPEQGRQ